MLLAGRQALRARSFQSPGRARRASCGARGWGIVRRGALRAPAVGNSHLRWAIRARSFQSPGRAQKASCGARGWGIVRRGALRAPAVGNSHLRWAIRARSFQSPGRAQKASCGARGWGIVRRGAFARCGIGGNKKNGLRAGLRDLLYYTIAGIAVQASFFPGTRRRARFRGRRGGVCAANPSEI